MTGAVAIRRLTIAGEPFAKQRPRARALGKGRVTIYTPQETEDAEAVVAAAWRAQHPDYVPDPEARYGLSVIFHRYARHRRDVDNLGKLLMDGLNGLAWVDDYQVETLHLTVRWVAKADARTEAAVWALGQVPNLLEVPHP